MFSLDNLWPWVILLTNNLQVQLSLHINGELVYLYKYESKLTHHY